MQMPHSCWSKRLLSIMLHQRFVTCKRLQCFKWSSASRLYPRALATLLYSFSEVEIRHGCSLAYTLLSTLLLRSACSHSLSAKACFSSMPQNTSKCIAKAILLMSCAWFISELMQCTSTMKASPATLRTASLQACLARSAAHTGASRWLTHVFSKASAPLFLAASSQSPRRAHPVGICRSVRVRQQ